MQNTKKLWLLLGIVLTGTFLILGLFGLEIYRKAPPIPERVMVNNQVLMTRDDILTGQQIWQSMGGQQIGSIWGHGAYQAPDWSADWLHREAMALLNIYSQKDFSKPYENLNLEQQASLQARLKKELRTNTFNPGTGALTVSPDRARAIAETAEHYIGVFSDHPKWHDLREAYAIQEDPLKTEKKRELLTKFFFWTSWACVTNRPGTAVTYTNNWPPESLVGNHPTAANILWSIISIVVLILGVGVLVWYKLFIDREEEFSTPAISDPLDQFPLTPSMKAIGKYAVTVVALFALQTILGAITAHYTVEGRDFYGFPLSKYLPYASSRTMHMQLAIFWIATAFMATGLFFAPVAGGREPKIQKLGVNVLFVALLIIVIGSLSGGWVAIQQKFESLTLSYWLGHQGYEYIDLGRAWQFGLFAGLIFWLFLMLRALGPALKRGDDSRQLIMIFAGASFAIALFYSAGFFYGSRSHLSVTEYWRWWVVHLWVEGFFEVFATTVLAVLFTKMGLVRAANATRAVLFTTSIFLVGGIPGTFHHLYWSGTPVSILAIGSTFSALEVVPLTLIGFEAWQTSRMSHQAPWVTVYKWPIRFFMGVAFWNLIGAGVFGFLINPPISLYYLQGLNTTPVHAHTALFGVYGLLALGLTLMILRRLTANKDWKTKFLSYSFWSLNIGLAMMVIFSLLPIGLIQAATSIEQGLWAARSADFLQQPLLQNFRWMRMVGDIIFLSGVGALVWFVAGLFWGWSLKPKEISSLKD